MTMQFSLNFNNGLIDQIDEKCYLGHYANEPMPKVHGAYEADRGWDNLFANFAQVRRGRYERAGATVHDTGRPAERPQRDKEIQSDAP